MSTTHVTIDDVTFLVRQNPRNKRLKLSINAEGVLAASVPANFTPDQIQHHLSKYLDWAREHLKRRQTQLSEKPCYSFLEGECLPYLGHYYPLHYDSSADTPRHVLYDDGVFILHQQEQANAKNHFLAWYTSQARDHFTARTKIYCPPNIFNRLTIEIGDLKTKWGSCATNGIIKYDYHLIMFPQEMGDYTVAHEVAHLTVPNHSPRFWSTLYRLMPDYKKRQKWIDDNGHKFIF